MKKILVALTLITGLIACEKQKNEFADFDYTTGYFPYQFPVRTLVLGDYIYDNTNDNDHKFLISAAMGGVYSNNQDRIFDLELANNLCNNVLFSAGGDTVRVMPPSYYTLSSKTQLVIPAGHVNGGIEVHLTDAFFADTLATRLSYVIPLRISNVTNLDSVLRGQSSQSNPDPRIKGLWDVQPKDFTMFAVNFINEYHGTYLHRGASTVKNPAGAVVENNVYRTPYIVDNELWSMKTISRNQVTINTNTHSDSSIKVPLKMNLTFSDNGTCTVTQAAGSDFTITGTGKFVKDGDEWGNKKRNAIYLDYQLTTPGDSTYSAMDTLVIRDRDIKLQVYSPEVF